MVVKTSDNKTSLILFSSSSSEVMQAAANSRPAEGAGGRHDNQQGGRNIHAVVLEPIQLVRRQTQVWRSTVSHHKLHPEHGGVQRRHRPIAVQRGQVLDT